MIDSYCKWFCLLDLLWPHQTYTVCLSRTAILVVRFLGAGNSRKSLPSKLEQGLNFTVIVDFWFCNGDFCTKTWGKKKRDFSRFYMRLKRVIFVLVQIQKVMFGKSADFFAFIGYPNLKDILLSAHNWQLRQCSCDWESCNVLKQCSLVWQVFAGTAVDRLLFYCSFNTRHVALKTWCLSKVRSGWPYAEWFWKLN